MHGNRTVGRNRQYGSYVDEPLMMKAGGSKYYFATNHLYSVAALTDSTGAVVERYKYDAYGRQGIMNLNGTVSYCPSDYGNFIGFTGRYHDWETGLIYFRTRYMDTTLGRFINRMPWFGMGNLRLSNYSMLVMDNDWRATFQMGLMNAQGSYIQGRYNLYDFERGNPGGSVEPYSWWLVGAAAVAGYVAYKWIFPTLDDMQNNVQQGVGNPSAGVPGDPNAWKGVSKDASSLSALTIGGGATSPPAWVQTIYATAKDSIMNDAKNALNNSGLPDYIQTQIMNRIEKLIDKAFDNLKGDYQTEFENAEQQIEDAIKEAIRDEVEKMLPCRKGK